MKETQFTLNIKEIAQRARENLAKGVITSNFKLDVSALINTLNEFLATELVCTLRYKNHYFAAKSLGASIAADEFLEHSNQEQGHADKLAERIVQLGGTPEMNPTVIADKAHCDYKNCETVEDMIRENLVAERIAVDSYRAMIQWLDNYDPTTRRLIEDILVTEEEHADDLLDLADTYDVNL